MKEISLDSNGKINLGLNVINKRKDGYHNLITIMQEISLRDRIILKNREEGILIESNDEEMPTDSSNLVYKSWELIKEYSKVERGIHIIIEKCIPMGAGLAGGSSNAATVLKGINQLWKLGLSNDELKRLAVKIGADVPFCIEGGTKIAKGIGNEFEDINSFSGRYILLINPRIHISTEEVYSNLILKDTDESKLDGLIQYINRGEDELVGKSLFNNLEGVVIPRNSEIQNIKDELLNSGALGSLMSGSGSTVFGLFNDEDSFERSYINMKKLYPDYLIEKCKTI